MLERIQLVWPEALRQRPWSQSLVRVLGTGAMWGMSLSAVISTILVVASLIPSGLQEITWQFLIDVPSAAGIEGGVSSVLVSTALLLVVCLLVATPISLLAGAYLATFSRSNRHIKGFVRVSLDVLASLPSVVFGLFGNALFCRTLGLGFSLLSGALTLACMVLPVMVRATEQALIDVPPGYRAAAGALGLSRAATLVFVELPAARTGIVAGAMLAAGRALSETAALIFTSGYVARMPGSLLESGRSMSVHIYDLAMNVPGGAGRANATALLLVGLILLGAGFTYRTAQSAWRLD